MGTRNYWLVLPLVFCENRNVDRLREALEEELGYGSTQNSYRQYVRQLVDKREKANERGSSAVAAADAHRASREADRVFPNLDGIRFLTHQGGCGGTRQDAQALCGLLAGYIHHPNVAGATVLSLGCQNAQASMLMDELRARDPEMTKAGAGVRSAKVGPRIHADEPRTGGDICGAGRGKQGATRGRRPCPR